MDKSKNSPNLQSLVDNAICIGQKLRRKKESRPVRIQRIGRKLADRHSKKAVHKPLRRKEFKPRKYRLIAYDLETTSIRAGTPKPVYLTAHAEDWALSSPVKSIEHLRDLLIEHFLTEKNNRARFVAWNGNKFDAYFVGAALLHSKDYILKPYLTRGNNLRGLRVISRSSKHEWEFLDGLSMIMGSASVSLERFLKTFAPDYQKFEAPDFDHEEFDPDNFEHRRYAERDSEGLWHGLQSAESIVQEYFNQTLKPTIGNLGIRIFQAHMPEGITVWNVPYNVEKIIRRQVLRGGYCYCNRPYKGKIWKYDLNQAYAAAMRDAWLPAGRCVHVRGFHPYAKCAIYRIRARKRDNPVPFYYIDNERRPIFSDGTINDTWITSIELEQLRSENWLIEIIEGYIWDDAFKMTEYVNKLEQLRTTGPGPKSARGEMIKAIGNNSYGKTVEQLNGIDLVLSLDRPEGYHQYCDEDELLQHIYFKFESPHFRDYHKPQIGAFITAHVRIVLRRAILQAPDSWIYSDTDSVMFDRPVNLDVDLLRYGKWKVECSGEEYVVITKKVYAALSGKDKKAKGLNSQLLTISDFESWYNGKAPKQTQTQRVNWLKVMNGANMFVERKKVGQK
jgi:hypothetical protein